MESTTTVDGSTVRDSLEELERDADDATLDELRLTEDEEATLDELRLVEDEDCSTFLLDEDVFLLELDFAELLLDDFFVLDEDEDLTTLEDDSSEGSVIELLSSPQARRKIIIKIEIRSANLFIIRNIVIDVATASRRAMSNEIWAVSNEHRAVSHEILRQVPYILITRHFYKIIF